MKVGTDGVLLGAWVNTEGAGRILDAGTGSGLIAIMMAQRSGAFIDAVETDPASCSQARENVAACPWKERILVHQDSFQTFAGKTANRYDLIVSNPPFFHNSLKPPVKYRAIARHDEKLSYESLLFYTAAILSEEGRLAVILPASEIARFTNLACLHDLHASRQTLVRPDPEKEYSRCLAEFTIHGASSFEKNGISIRNAASAGYSNEYIDITRQFYLSIA
jgi:tRNA1Val (adenine37-N6)-methyltransferase